MNKIAFNGEELLNAAKGFLRGSSKAHGEAVDAVSHAIPFGDKIKSVVQRTPEELKARLQQQAGEHGTFGLVDFPLQVLRKAPGVKNILTEERWAKGVHGYQSWLDNADRKAGEWLTNKAPKRVKGMFTQVEESPAFSVPTEGGKTVDGFVHNEVQRATAPLEKTIHHAKPMLSLLGIGALAQGMRKTPQPSQGEGDTQMKIAEEKDGGISIEVYNNLQTYLEKAAATAENSQKAAVMLKQAATKLRELEMEINKVAEDNKRLTLQLIAKERSSRATKLANEMFSKRIIKQGEIDSEVDRIMEMDDKAFEVLASTVRNVGIQKDSNNINKGLDTISFLLDSEDGAEKKSFEDSLKEL